MQTKIRLAKSDFVKNLSFNGNASRQTINIVDIQTRRTTKKLKKEDLPDEHDHDDKKKQGKNTENQDLPITHKEYLLANFNQVQTTIVSFLQPISTLHCKEIVWGFMEIWLASIHFTKIGMNVNEGCSKIIQLLLSLSIEPYEVIDSINKIIIEKEF